LWLVLPCSSWYCWTTTKNNFSNKYVLVAIDHYSKWWKARPIKEHVESATKFLEKEIICRFEVLKYVLINNGEEWMAKFDLMWKKIGITHQYTTPHWHNGWEDDQNPETWPYYCFFYKHIKMGCSSSKDLVWISLRYLE